MTHHDLSSIIFALSCGASHLDGIRIRRWDKITGVRRRMSGKGRRDPDTYMHT